jgi:hypothetical protein
MLIVLAFATHNPLILRAQPLLERLLQRMNNKAGKDAVAALAMEVEKDEEIRRIAFEVREQLLPFLSEIYRLQQARGAIGVDAGTTMLNADVSVADALASVGVMLHRMEERLVNPEGCDPDRPLHDRLVLTGPTQTMRARAKSDGQQFEVRAARYGSTPRLILELTNMSKTDVRPLALYVDVIECLDIDIEDVWSWYGMMRPMRKYSAPLEAKNGRYRCVAAEANNGEYLVLTPGELEVFSITLAPPQTQALYRLRVAVELSTGGQTFVQEFERVVQFGAFDGTPWPWTKDHPRHGDGPPPDDGGDTCVQDSQAMILMMSAAGRARAPQSGS